ncbi:MAG: helix-turn-helix transcriptional regulator [Gordonibacter sp.]
MEKSTRTEEIPRQAPSSAVMLCVVGGLSLFWACFFTLLMRNSFLDPSLENLWYHLALRIALLVGFGACAFGVSRLRVDSTARRPPLVLFAGVAAFSLVAALSPLAYLALNAPLPLAFDLAAWALSGAGLGCLFFLWVPVVSNMDKSFTARCMAFSAACGGFVYLIINLLPSYFSITMLVVCPLASLVAQRIVAHDAGLCENAGIPYATSKENAGLSWSFGIIYIGYGIVFGLGAGSITQLSGDVALFGGTAAFILLGSGIALVFMNRFSGRMSQIDVLRMVFPFLVVSLVCMTLFTGVLYALSNLLLLAGYLFLVVVSVAFEVQASRARKASPLFFVGMSQTALSGGMAGGFALGLLASATGTIDFAVLSGIALGLVVLLALFITFAPRRATTDPDEAADTPDTHEQGHWKVRCAAVAHDAGLSARETEVFFLLAKGRGIEHIQNKLCISGHTVKTHTYNIYRKMGINSREELLDAIEAGVPGALQSRYRS